MVSVKEMEGGIGGGNQLLKQITPLEHARAAIKALQTSTRLHGKRAM